MVYTISCNLKMPSFPTATAPIFYDQAQIASINPQLDDLISQCDALLGEAA